MPTLGKLRQGGLFFVANLLAGFLHYLYQLVAAGRLSSADFAALNGWFADVALCFFLSGLLQYAANFSPAPRARLRVAVLAIAAVCVAGLIAWFTRDGLGWTRGAVVIVAAGAFAWLLGQAQIRLAFGLMSIGNLLFGLTKLGLAFWPMGAHALEPFAFALFGGYLPAILVLAIVLWRSADVATTPTPSWSAPIMLSLAGAIIPQFDMVLMNHTQDAETFQSFAQASLFYKGIYFALFILAQWLLPQQIHRPTRTPVRSLLATGLCAFAVSVVIWALAPFVSTMLLHWPTPPDGHLVFWSCLHMSVLTMLFFWVQETCAFRRPQLAIWTVAAFALEAGVQMLVQAPAATYVVTITLVQIAVLIGAHVLSRRLA